MCVIIIIIVMRMFHNFSVSVVANIVIDLF